MTQLPRVVQEIDGNEFLTQDAEDTLAAIGYGLTLEQTAAALHWSVSKASRLRSSIESHFGYKPLAVLVSFLNAGTLSIARPSRAFRNPRVADGFNSALGRLKTTNPRQALSEADVTALLTEYPSYPRVSETVWHQRDDAQRILAKAGITNPRTGSYAIIMAVGGQIGRILAADLPRTTQPGVLTFTHRGVAISMRGEPGKAVEVTIDGVRVTRTIPGTQ